MISDEYQATIRQMHETTVWGNKGFKYYEDVWAFYTSIACKSILDYGCGQQTLSIRIKELWPGTDVRDYDPGIPALAALPDPADLVVSTDVFEHIEPDNLRAVIDHVFSLARRGVYLHIALTPAKRSLPDGRNAHLITENADWWLAELQAVPAGWQLLRHIPGRKTLKLWFVR